MYKKTILNLFFLLAFTQPVIAQNTTAYNLETDKVMQLLMQANSYRFTKPDSCLKVAGNALRVAQALKFKKGEGEAHSIIGEFHRVSGNFPEALQHLFTSLSISREIKDTAMEGGSLTFIGITYLGLQEFRTALDYLLQAYEKMKNRPEINITAFALTNIGVAYQQMNMLDSGLIFQKKAWQVGKNMPVKPGIAFMLRETGIIYALQHKYDSALYYYRNALASSNDVLNIGRIYTRMSMLYDEMNKSDSVIYYARLALSHGQKSLQKVTMLDASRLLTNYFLKRDQPDSVIKYQQITMSLKDSLFGQEQFRKLQMLAINEQKEIYAAEEKQQIIESEQKEYRDRIRLYSLMAASVVLLILGIILYRNNRRKQIANDLLEKQKNETEKTLGELRTTQTQLIQSEKMASLGELTAGIAHEIQNPLNFVNNFSEVNKELITEMKYEIDKGNFEEVKAIATDIEDNEQKINYHGKRADAIVKNMLQHSRSSNRTKELTDINALCDEYFRLSYHGLRAKDKSFNATLQTHFDEEIGKMEIVPQDIGRVLLNLYNNAFYAVSEKKKTASPPSKGGISQEEYEPTVSITTKKENNTILIKVTDNGMGIPQKVVDKIFQPFFTTKPTGEGTGLGLSLSYDIIKAHGGELKVETKVGEGAEFIIQVPFN